MRHKKTRDSCISVDDKRAVQRCFKPLLFFLSLHLFIIFPFYGCAPSKLEVKQETEKRDIALDKISVREEGNGVLIEATGPITYTAFKLSDPLRLVLDIPRVDIEKVSGRVEVNSNFINTITTTKYGEQVAVPIARVEIELKDDVSHDIKLGENNIVVSLKYDEMLSTQAASLGVSSVPEGAIPGALSAEESLVQEAIKDEVPLEKTAAVNGPLSASQKGDDEKAHQLLRIDADSENDRTVIKVVSDGVIGDFNAFIIDKPSPARLVVDVWNVGSSIPGAGLKIDSAQIKRVRVGVHPNKVRLVFDSGQDILPPYTIERIEKSLVITTGVVKRESKVSKAEYSSATSSAGAKSATIVAAAVPESTEPVKTEYAEIRAIDFKQLTNKGRLTIRASKKVEYRVSKSPDEANLVLDIRDALLANELKRTLDASDLNTPVVSISSFQASTEPEKIVRILIRLREKAAYDIMQESERIQVDFPLAVAQTPPMATEIKAEAPEEIAGRGEGEPARYTGRKISLDFKDADINNILRLMAEVSNLNIIAGDDVKGKVSLRLVDVPWDQAFDIILKTNGLGKVQEGNVVRIMPLAKIKLETEELLASKKAKEKLEDLEVKLWPVSYSKADDLKSQVKDILSDRGTVATETRTNMLIIKDIPDNITRAIDLIKRLDTPTPQVLIEARIVEAQSSFARDLGVQWGGVHGAVGTNNFLTTYGSSGVTPPIVYTSSGFIGSAGQIDKQPQFAVSLPASGAAGTLGAMGFTFGKLTGDPLMLDLRISAGEKNGLTKTISRPRITTIDNKEAKISQGDSVPFETTSATGTQTEFIDATLELTVTPHITPDGSVSMKIKASRNSIGSFRSATGTPSISKKEASTEIIVKDGETAVIGGIVVADKSDSDSGIPFLKDIPVLGWLFKNKSVSDSQTELLIFITPTIVKDKVDQTS